MPKLRKEARKEAAHAAITQAQKATSGGDCQSAFLFLVDAARDGLDLHDWKKDRKTFDVVGDFQSKCLLRKK